VAEFVTIRHPDLPDAQPARVTRQAFELVHQPKGWEVVGDAPATAPEPARSLSITEQIERAQASANAPAATESTDGDAPALTPAKRTPRPAADGKEG
jgi:hypothetical protein